MRTRAPELGAPFQNQVPQRVQVIVQYTLGASVATSLVLGPFGFLGNAEKGNLQAPSQTV